MYKKTMGAILTNYEGKLIIYKNRNTFHINEIGAKIFNLCDGKNSTDEIAKQISLEYNEDIDIILQDTELYLGELLINKLIKKV